MGTTSVGLMHRVWHGTDEYVPTAIVLKLARMPKRKGPLVKTKEQIDELIEDVKELGSRIKSIDELITRIDNEELKDKYNKDLLALIANYKKMLGLLEQNIAEYTKFEREQNLPVSILYRRILKSLRD
jgi:hypothetical protein